MEQTIEAIEKLFYAKVLLYQELKECLRRERDCLIRTDIDGLWRVAEQKKSVASRIKGVQVEILEALSEALIDHGMSESSFSLAKVFSLIPREHCVRFKSAYMSLVSLKGETRQRSRENIVFIEESLDFLDELIGTIAGVNKEKPTYGNGRSLTGKGYTNLLLHKEV